MIFRYFFCIIEGIMSAESLPEYPNLFELPSEKISEIEAKCHKAGHLDSKERLLDRISSDIDTLKKFNLAKADIYTNHRNMYLKFNKVDEFDAYTCAKDQDISHAKNLLDNLPENFGNDWSMQRKATNEIKLNGQHLRITCFVWGGAEQCRIEKSLSDKYYGYSRGDRDWFVTNLDLGLNIWVPDLLPAQVGMFGFSQSPSSAYHLDLEKYIKIMGLEKSEVALIKSHKEIFWGTDGAGSNSIDTDVDIIEETDTELYHALCHWGKYDKTRKSLQIRFKDDNWIKDNKNARIKVFELDLDVANIINNIIYAHFEESCIIVLDDRDDSDAISIKTRGQSSCSIQ